MIRRVSINSHGNWDYVYDVRNHRVQKNYPQGYVDRFTYGAGDELLEDRQSNYGSGADVVDEYVWLDGKAVATRRTIGGPGWLSDGYPQCSRSSDIQSTTTPCGIRYPVFDVTQRPVLVLDSSRAVTGVGEYEPFGARNVQRMMNETTHTYVDTTDCNVDVGYGPNLNLYWNFTQPTVGLSLVGRAHYSFLDTEACNSTNYDWVRMEDQGGTALGSPSGGELGDYSSSWVAMPTNGLARVHFSSDSTNRVNCQKGTGCPMVRAYRGVVLADIQYERYTSFAPFFIPLRAPGQYADPESGYYENWNRYYDPSAGRYLSPEPLLDEPLVASERAREGRTLPAYAYASNNPVGNYDPDGLLDPGGWVPPVAPPPPGAGLPDPTVWTPPTPAPLNPPPTPEPLVVPPPGPVHDPKTKACYPAGSDPNKEHCIALYVQCKQKKWVGRCGDCLNKCTAQNEWDFDMCHPKRR